MRVLIAGCGDVGSSLGVILAGQGHHVYGLRRSVDGLPKPLEPVAADLTVPDSLVAIPQDIDLLYYTAAAAERSEQGYRLAYVDGLANVLARCAETSPNLRHVFYTSSTSVYGQTDGGWVTEDSPSEPGTYSGQTILEGEALLARAEVSSSSIRFGGIYGPGRTYLIRTLLDGTAGLKGSEEIYTNRIHRDDCAGFLAHLADVESLHATYLGVDDEPAPYNDVLRFIAAQLAIDEPPIGHGKRGDRIRGSTNKRCSNQRLTESGYRLAYPSYREGYGELVANYERAAN